MSNLDPCTCAICYGHRIAYSWPPVCCEHCRVMWESECNHDHFASHETAFHEQQRGLCLTDEQQQR